MLPDYKKAQVFNHNILPQAYTHPSNKSPKEVTKEWRRNQQSRHDDIADFARATFNDPQYNLTTLSTNMDKALIPDKSREVLQKITPFTPQSTTNTIIRSGRHFLVSQMTRTGQMSHRPLGSKDVRLVGQSRTHLRRFRWLHTKYTFKVQLHLV